MPNIHQRENRICLKLYDNGHYQSLRNFEDLPALPLGYPGMFFLALFPAAYRAVMDKRTVAWAGGDLSKIQIRKGKRAYYERKFADAA